MKRTTQKKTLKLQKDTVRVLVRPLDESALKHVVGGDYGGSLVDCKTRDWSDACPDGC